MNVFIINKLKSSFLFSWAEVTGISESVHNPHSATLENFRVAKKIVKDTLNEVLDRDDDDEASCEDETESTEEFDCESVDGLLEDIDGVDLGVAVVQKGKAFVCSLTKAYKKRKEGDLSRKEFIEIVVNRLSESLLSAGFAIGGACAGAALSGVILGPAGVLVGTIVSGRICSSLGKQVGSDLGPRIGLKITSMIRTDDRAVQRIDVLNKGDHVVFYDGLRNPRHHVIVVDRDPKQNKVRVIHNTKKGVVENEQFDFTTPAYRLEYDEREVNEPDEVIRKARSKIGDGVYAVNVKSSKEFARWCKLRQTDTKKF